jgi:hypothetical protein
LLADVIETVNNRVIRIVKFKKKRTGVFWDVLFM